MVVGSQAEKCGLKYDIHTFTSSVRTLDHNDAQSHGEQRVSLSYEGLETRMRKERPQDVCGPSLLTGFQIAGVSD
jgi:hypothetical protein